MSKLDGYEPELVTIIVDNIDLVLLRQQYETLSEHQDGQADPVEVSEALEGILNLLEAILEENEEKKDGISVESG